MPSGKMSGQGSLRRGNCPIKENLCLGHRGTVSRGSVLGKVSVGEQFSREIVPQSFYLTYGLFFTNSQIMGF